MSHDHWHGGFLSQALIDCLDRDAIVLREHDGELKPCVTQGSLSRALREKVPELLYPPELGRWEPPERRQVPELYVASPEMPIVSV
jgi:hypothetical protein